MWFNNKDKLIKKAVFEQAKLGYWWIDLKTKKFHVSDVARDILPCSSLKANASFEDQKNNLTKCFDLEADKQMIEQSLDQLVIYKDPFSATVKCTIDGNAELYEISGELNDLHGADSIALGSIRCVTDRQFFQEALNKLQNITIDVSAVFEEKLEYVLQLGCDMLGMSSALISQIDHNSYRVLATDPKTTNIKVGAIFPLEDTFCNIPFTMNHAVAYPKIKGTDLESYPPHKNMSINAYMSAPYTVFSKKYGTVCFFSQNERSEFSPMMHQLLQTISQWVAYAVESNLVEQRLRNTHNQLKIAATVKDEFLANMSHELRTPMNGVLGMCDLLEMSEINNTEKEHIASLRTSANDMMVIINDILDIDKLEKGEITLHPKNFFLPDLVERQAKEYQKQAEAKGLKFNFTKGSACTLFADSGRIGKIMRTLLSNAIKFTKEGQIDFKVTYQQKQLVIEVKDTGIGIEESQLESIFKAFEQEDNSSTRSFGGLGIGLSICSHIVTKMSGQLKVKSQKDGGSTFKVTLPIEEAGKASEQQPEESTENNVSDQTHILVVEDNIINQKACQDLLKALGYRVSLANSGEQALDHLSEEPVDLILMDIQMPGLDGIETTKAIRKEEAAGRLTHIPIIACTANIREEQVQHYKEIGMEDTLAKPYSIEDLKNVLIENLPKA